MSVVHQYRVQQDSPAVSDHRPEAGEVDPPQVEVENEVVTGLHHQRANLQSLSEVRLSVRCEDLVNLIWN